MVNKTCNCVAKIKENTRKNCRNCWAMLSKDFCWGLKREKFGKILSGEHFAKPSSYICIWNILNWLLLSSAVVSTRTICCWLKLKLKWMNVSIYWIFSRHIVDVNSLLTTRCVIRSTSHENERSRRRQCKRILFIALR